MILSSFLSEVLKTLPGVKNPFTLAALIGLFLFIIIYSITARDEISVSHVIVLFMIIASTCGITYALLQGERKTMTPFPESGPTIRYFNMSEDRGRVFYAYLADSYLSATRSIHMSGRGFKEVDFENAEIKPSIERTMRATEYALQQNIKIVRIQTSDDVAERWGAWIGAMLDRFPDTLELYMDTKDPPLVNVAVVDADSPEGEVQLLFESAAVYGTKSYFKAVSAAVVEGHQDLARGLRDDIVERTKQLHRIANGSELERYFEIFYFAYGSNLVADQLQKRCPSAKVISKGYLYNWELVFNVQADHRRGRVAGIREKKSGCVEGMIIRLSRTDRDELRSIEGGGYREEQFTIMTESAPYKALVYVPERVAENKALPVSQEYLNVMLRGAREYGLESTVRIIESELEGRETD